MTNAELMLQIALDQDDLDRLESHGRDIRAAITVVRARIRSLKVKLSTAPTKRRVASPRKARTESTPALPAVHRGMEAQ